jgi:hypothetical protein
MKKQPNRFKRLIGFIRHYRDPKPLLTPDRPDDPPDIGVREPRRPRPGSGSGSAVLDPPE